MNRWSNRRASSTSTRCAHDDAFADPAAAGRVSVSRFGIGSRAAFACIAYAVIRIVVEAFKAADPEPGIVATGLANGQLYSLALLAAGVAIFMRTSRFHPTPIAK